MSAFAGAGRSAAQVDEASLAGAGDTRYLLLKPNTLGIKQIPVSWLDQASIRALLGIQKKNYIINGAMMVSQENGATPGATNTYYPVDQFFIASTRTGAFTAAQVTALTPGGSPNRLRFTVTTAGASVAAGDLALIVHNIEGIRTSDLKYGTSAAKPTILQFGVKAPAGTYCISIENSAQTRAFVAEYVILPGEANTEVVKSVLIPGDLSGAWLNTNGVGLRIYWSLMVGSTFQQGLGWGTGNFLGTPNQFNLMSTVGNVFELFDVGLYEGVDAPPFVVPDYDDCLRDCQRFWELVGMTVTTVAPPYHNTAWYRVTKRTAPTLTPIGNAQSATVGPVSSSPADGVRQINPASTPADIGISVNARLS
jgi:hypothetical protein